MEHLPDELLIETYYRSIALNIERKFIILLEHELAHRSLVEKALVLAAK